MAGVVSRVRSSPRLQRRLAAVALAVVVVAAMATTAILFWNTASRRDAPISTLPADIDPGAKVVPLADETREAARTWIMGAVTRRDLAGTYDLTHKDIRGSLTREEWEAGAIPVIPYPVDEIGPEHWRTDFSYADEAMLEVRLNPGVGGEGQKPLTFFIGLVRDDGRWLINYWVPRYRPGVPLAQ